jgi:hypothetical protein
MARISALLVATVVLGTEFGAAAARSSVTAKPLLQLIQRAPLKVQGKHFKARERVRLSATTTRGKAVAITRSTRLGRIVATFSNFSARVCDSLVVTAVGAGGDRATLEVSPPPPVEGPAGPTSPGPCPA